MLSNNLLEEKAFCGYIADDKKRSRALASIIGLRVAFDFFKKCGLEPSVNYAAHKIRKVFEAIDIADLYIGNIRLDVRLCTSINEFAIPIQQYEIGVTPDLYMFVYYDKDTETAEVAGFILPDKIDKSKYDDNYYYVSRNLAVSVNNLENIFDSLNVKAKTGLPLNCKKKIILYLDNQLLGVNEFYQDLMKYEKARELLFDYVNAENIYAECNFDTESELILSETPSSALTFEDIELGFADGLSSEGQSEINVDIIKDENLDDKIEIAEQNDDLSVGSESSSKNIDDVFGFAPEEPTDAGDNVNDYTEAILADDNENVIEDSINEADELETLDLTQFSDENIQTVEKQEIESLDVEVPTDDIEKIDDEISPEDTFSLSDSESLVSGEVNIDIEPDEVLDLDTLPAKNFSDSLEDEPVEKEVELELSEQESDLSFSDEESALSETEEVAELGEVEDIDLSESESDLLFSDEESALSEAEEVAELGEVEDLDLSESESDLSFSDEESVLSEAEEVAELGEVEDLDLSEPDSDLTFSDDEPLMNDTEKIEEADEFNDDIASDYSENENYSENAEESGDSEDSDDNTGNDNEDADEEDDDKYLYQSSNLVIPENLSFVDDNKKEAENIAEEVLKENSVETNASSLTFTEFADDIEQIDKNTQKENEQKDKLNDVSKNDSESLVSELDKDLETELVKEVNSGIDIKAAMEGFVNTLEPDEAIEKVNNKAEISTKNKISSVLSSEIKEDKEDEVLDENPHVEQEINQLYNEGNEQPVIETSGSYKKPNKASNKNLIGGLFVLLIALGIIGFTQKDLIMEKIQGSNSVESVPNELAAPVDNSIAPKKQKTEVETEAEAMLQDIEEPVQLLDTSVSITAITVDCDVPSNMVNPYSRRYFMKLAKRMQIELKNALLIASEQPLANKIIVDLSVDKDTVKYEKISSSSGSKKVDSIAASTAEAILRKTQPYAGTFGSNKGIIRLIVKF